MRILLDESLPRRLKSRLVGHDVATVVECGWSGVKNGELLALASSRFDAFVTADRSLEFQQNLSELPISVFVLVTVNSRLESLLPLIPELLRALAVSPERPALRRVGVRGLAT